MSTPKQPQDHLPKKAKVEQIEVTVGEGDEARVVPARRTVIRGITVTVTDEAMDDFELLDDLNQVDVKRNASRLPSLLRRMLGEEGTREALDALRDKSTGRVPIQTGTEFVKEIFEALNPNS